MKKTERLQALIKSYEYLVENNFMIPEGIRIDSQKKERIPSLLREEISTGVFAVNTAMSPEFEEFVIFEGEYLPKGKQVNVTNNAIKLLHEIKALREELGIEATPLKDESELEKVATEATVLSENAIRVITKTLSALEKATRTVDVSEIKEVAEGQRIESKNGAINAVTSPEEEKNKEGQSHNDE